MKCRQEDYTATEASCFLWLVGCFFYYYIIFSPFPGLCSAAEHTSTEPWRPAISVQRGKAGGSDIPVCQAAAV